MGSRVNDQEIGNSVEQKTIRSPVDSWLGKLALEYLRNGELDPEAVLFLENEKAVVWRFSHGSCEDGISIILSVTQPEGIPEYLIRIEAAISRLEPSDAQADVLRRLLTLNTEIQSLPIRIAVNDLNEILVQCQACECFGEGILRLTLSQFIGVSRQMLDTLKKEFGLSPFSKCRRGDPS